MKTVLAGRDLVLGYDGRTVLDRVSLEIGEGEFFVIIGPNGAGKTTLLKTLAGLERPQRGTVTVFEKNLTRMGRRDLARVMALVPQQLPLDFPFTVADTVLMGRSPHLGLLGLESARDREIAAAAMGFTDILHLRDRTLDQLSGGERQRTVIARAICQEPRLILLDEPTAALDPAHQLKVMDLMERFCREQRVTVVMVSHDLNLAALYGSRLLLLHRGRVAALGSPAEVLTEELLFEAYGCRLQVDVNPLAGVPRVTPVPGRVRGLSAGGED